MGRIALALALAFVLLHQHRSNAQEVKTGRKNIDAAAAAKKLQEFLGRFPGRSPGYAVVVVTPEEEVMKYAEGVRRASAKSPITFDTPIYIASQTKAYIGLLAARLDAEGIFKLDDKITDHWPEVKFPEGVDPSEYTLKDLLGHRVPIQVGYITGMEAYRCELDPADYPTLIKQFGVARDPGFSYDNLGYNIWAAILHKATGKSWRIWLDEKIFDPLGMDHTSSRTSDFDLDELAWSHMWQGEEKGWLEIRPKRDGMMQSAGGLVTSTNDMAKWLQLHLNSKDFKDSGITASMIETSHKIVSDVTGPSPYELESIGYALGWSVCEFEGYKVYMHGGGYTGARTVMAFIPELGVGIGVFSNSDNITGWLTQKTALQFFQYLTNQENAEQLAQECAKEFPLHSKRLLESRTKQLKDARENAVWEGWKWKPTQLELAEYVGKYEGQNKYETLVLSAKDGKLQVNFGEMTATLEPAKRDLFGGISNEMTPPDQVRFERGDNGKPAVMKWNQFELKKVE
jgi:CubicO group peptidase (beta-lactamase class C family)